MEKTSEDVRKWLESQTWFEAFKTNTERRYWYAAEMVQSILSGKYLEATMLVAFDWDYAKEGTDYWTERQDEFLDWFSTQTLF